MTTETHMVGKWAVRILLECFLAKQEQEQEQEKFHTTIYIQKYLYVDLQILGRFNQANKEDGSHAGTVPSFASNKKLNQFL